MNCPPSRISRKRASSSGISGAYCALTSMSGIVCTATHCSGLAPPIQEIRREQQKACHHRVLRVTEVVVELLVARAEPVAGARDPERPDGGPDQSEHGVRAERKSEDARRNRDERADNRRDAADEHADVAPVVEPALRPVEALGR